MVLLMVTFCVRSANGISMVTRIIVIDLHILIINDLIDGDVVCSFYQYYFDALDDAEQTE